MFSAETPSAPPVLVVEDEQKTLDSLAEGLRMEAWAVETAASGEEALGLLGRERGRGGQGDQRKRCCQGRLLEDGMDAAHVGAPLSHRVDGPGRP